MRRCEMAAKTLAKEGVEAEIVDLRSLSPEPRRLRSGNLGVVAPCPLPVPIGGLGQALPIEFPCHALRLGPFEQRIHDH